MVSQNNASMDSVIYVGNDTNDLPCFPLVACAIAVADSHPDVLRQADFRLTHRGGHGAVREICDLILSKNQGD
jgi:N-acylneuraminate cytidylyltransferase